MARKRLICAICGEKMDYQYTSVLHKGKIQKVCSEKCFKKALNNEENINGRGVNRSVGVYTHR